tara:strand:+ start:10902 stop:12332 length:1431 start_codon:yes stop_codon:yes gene_type:complete
MKFKTARRITANFISLITAQVISRVIQLIIFIYLARELGKSDFGIFSFAIAFGFLFVIISDFGLTKLLVREISRDKNSASKYLSNALIVKICLSIISIIAAYLFLNMMNYAYGVKLIAYVMLFFTLIQSFTELYFSIFAAFEKMHYDALIKIMRMVLSLFGVFFLIKNGYGLLVISLLFLVTELIVLIIAMFVTYSKFAKATFKFDYGFSKELLKKSSLFCFSLIFTTLYMYIDQIMLSKLRSTTEVGIYAAAANITIALIFIPLMYGNSIYPVISRFYITSKKSLSFAYERSFKYMLLIGLPIAVGIYILSDKIILFLYGREYIESVLVLGILSGYIFLKFLNPVTGFTLMAINKQRTRLFSQGLAALINIILNFILIPQYGVIGAALATLLTEIIFFIMYTSFIIKYGFKFKFILKFLHKPIIAVIIMAFSLAFVGDLFLSIVIGMFIYIASLLVLRTIDKEDKVLLNKIIKNI